MSAIMKLALCLSVLFIAGPSPLQQFTDAAALDNSTITSTTSTTTTTADDAAARTDTNKTAASSETGPVPETASKPTGKGPITTVDYLPGSVATVVVGEGNGGKSTSTDVTAGSDNNDDVDNDDDEDDEVEGQADSPRFTMETFVTIFVTVLIVLSNCTIIIVAACTEAFSNFNKVFIYSMSLADLLIGLLVMPYSIFLSVYRRWVFASGTFCNIEAYVFLTLHGAKLFSLTWLNVDHYIAVRKPERYNVMMSKTRSVCWIIISWLAAICFFMPPMLSFKNSFFNRSIFVCQADTEEQIAYMLTAVVLVSVPTLLALFITNIYLFTKSYKKRIRFYEKVFVELSTRPWNYHITFVMCIVQATVWVPFSILSLIQEFLSAEVDDRAVFYLCWLGFCCSFTNFFVLFAMCPPFRQAVWEMYSLYDWCPRWCCCCKRQRHQYSSDVNVITLTRKR